MWQSILDLPSYYEGTLTQIEQSLEQTIQHDFGSDGLARFRDYKVKVDAPLNDPEFKVGYVHDYRRDLLRKSMGDNKVIGKLYHISTYRLNGVSAEGVNTELRVDREGALQKMIGVEYSVTLDLNPQSEQARYLKLLFSYR
jgi:hypothetical protein